MISKEAVKKTDKKYSESQMQLLQHGISVLFPTSHNY